MAALEYSVAWEIKNEVPATTSEETLMLEQLKFQNVGPAPELEVSFR
jgi:hypothetical protein